MSSVSLSAGAIPLAIDQCGNFQYDVIAKVGHSSNRIIYTRPKDALPKAVDKDELFPRPSAHVITETTEKTRLALEAIIQQRIKSTQPKNIGPAEKSHSLIKYKPSEDAFMNKEAPKERLVRMVEQKVDPLDPSKFKHKKIPRGPPSPPVPVLHSPPRKATPEEHRAWIVPPSISNWKNPKGYIIPLDKRLACDGRGLQEAIINENFASFAESLYVAEIHAREEVSKRNELERQLAEQERHEKETRLRELAQQARQNQNMPERQYVQDDGADADEPSSLQSLSLAEREEIRREKAKERQREYRLSKLSAGQRSQILAREEERDISEKIALGVARPSSVAGSSIDTMFDQRLFNQSEGMSSGFNPSDESYDIYDRPLFTGSSANVIYKPRKDLDAGDDNLEEQDSKELRKEKGKPVVSGVDYFRDRFHESGRGGKGTGSGPILFERGETMALTSGSGEKKRAGTSEKDGQASALSGIVDPFDLDSFLQAAKKGKRAV